MAASAPFAQARQNAVLGRKRPEDQAAMRAQRRDVLLEGRGRSKDRELVQHCGSLGRLRLFCGSADDPEHAVGKPAHRERHLFADLARGRPEFAA